MPSFVAQVPNLQSVGPVVELRLAVGTAAEAALRASGSPLPALIPVVSMIDTGATSTVIRQGLAAQLGLNPVGVTYINTPSSTNVPCYEFLVRLMFPNNVLFETTVLEAPLRANTFSASSGEMCWRRPCWYTSVTGTYSA